MKFRTRLVLTLSAATALTTASAFGIASYVVERSEERQLDDAIRTEARREARQVARGAAAGGGLHVDEYGGAEADDVGRLRKFAALYAADGAEIHRTRSFDPAAPAFDTVAHPPNTTFDFVHEDEPLRGVLVGVSGHPEVSLLLAAPRAPLEEDNTFLREVMLIASLLSIGCTVLVTWRVVLQLTRGHEAIAAAARKVAAGDLGARVALTAGDDEVVQLAHDIDEMVRRLAILVEGQQRFVANAAHELRSPLTVLYGELQLALRRSRTAEEYRKTIDEALDAARRLTVLADDLLALARLGADRNAAQTPVSLAEVIQNAASSVAGAAERRRIALEIEADDSIVLGKAMDLERMLRNLLDNAVRHGPEDSRVRLRARTDGAGVVVTVHDSGPGIDPVDRERVFEPFFRADDERRRDEGTGLGLAIVREIARVHGGDVTVEDGPDGEGALFRAWLPAGAQEQPARLASA